MTPWTHVDADPSIRGWPTSGVQIHPLDQNLETWKSIDGVGTNCLLKTMQHGRLQERVHSDSRTTELARAGTGQARRVEKVGNVKTVRRFVPHVDGPLQSSQ
jgi:hypothetical protein